MDKGYQGGVRTSPTDLTVENALFLVTMWDSKDS